MLLRILLFMAIALGACAPSPDSPDVPDSPKPDASGRYLYVWTGDVGREIGDTDFLATIDVDEASPSYGRVIATTPVGLVGTMPHHMELTFPEGQTFFASGFESGQIFLFDMTDPAQPQLMTTIDSVPGYRRPHSFMRRPDGNVVATLQYRSSGPAEQPGGLALFDRAGQVIKTVSSADARFTDAPIRTYALDVAPDVDRLVTTSAPMAMTEPSADVVQIYRLSDLELLETLDLPVPEGDTVRFRLPFEIRVLQDGRSAFLNTYTCGFYLVDGIDGPTPTIERVYTLEKPEETGCSVPALVGNYWIMPVSYANKIVVLDVSDPRQPREAFLLPTDPGLLPHWAVKDPGSDRVVLTGFDGEDARVLMMRFDETSGALSWDETFRDPDTGELGIDFDRPAWPHGETGKRMPHGAVFRR